VGPERANQIEGRGYVSFPRTLPARSTTVIPDPVRARLDALAVNAFRIVFGLMLLQHGAQKLFAVLGREEPVQLMSQMGLAGVLEFWGGLLVVVGLFARPVAFLLSGMMAWAYFQAHFRVEFPDGWIPILNRGEMAVLYCFAFFLIAFHGGGSFSLDGWLARRKMGVVAPALVAALALSLAVSACGGGAPPRYDLVVANGRVMDPESGLDAARNVGIRGGKIEAVSEEPLEGARVVDATGHVVAPGFIDLHEHGQEEESYAMMVRDGVTSAFELEVGTGDVPAWYAAREGGQLVNYGVAVGHIPARMRVLGDPSTGLLPAGVGGTGAATEEQIERMEEILREGLRQGAVAVGLGSAYTPGGDMAEIERMFRVAGEAGASSHIHIRGGVVGLDSTIAAARSAGGPLHVVHVNSVANDAIDTFFVRIQAARDAGQDVTTEAYPYGAGMTSIQSALFDDWESWPEERYGLHQLVSTGERLTRETFAKARAEGGMVIIHGRSEEQTRAAIVHPLSLIASDGVVENGRGHPRTSGTFAKVLGKYVRDEHVVELMAALRRMTVEPARRLEARVPGMALKGRLRVGADADLTIFDPATVADRATYEDATIPSAGIPYVIVGGQLVVDGGSLTPARPGRAIRAPVSGN
jgi:N-acyl-D-aspartate/D-glutamate deacylase/uncharacterized membrane protein YphA (DoxX/SURF4 family)